MLSGLTGAAPAAHLAPMSASFHPLMLDRVRAGGVGGLPIYLTHGARDWMFPVVMARAARAALRRAGAEIEYREIVDLSHAYPVEENARIRDWFLAH